MIIRGGASSLPALNWRLNGVRYTHHVPVVEVDEKERTMSSEEQELSAAMPVETTEAPEEEPTDAEQIEEVEEDSDDDDDDDDDDGDDDDDAPADDKVA